MIWVGFMTETTAREMLWALVEATTGRPGHLWPHPLVALCPHAPRAGCFCRKPQPGMLTYMMSAHGRTPAETIFVGDQEADREAAMAAGCDFLWAEDFFERRIP